VGWSILKRSFLGGMFAGKLGVMFREGGAEPRTSPSGTDGGTFGRTEAARWRILVGLDERNEFDRATLDILGIPFSRLERPSVGPRTIVCKNYGIN